MSAKPIIPGELYWLKCAHFTTVVAATNAADAIAQGIERLIAMGVQP